MSIDVKTGIRRGDWVRAHSTAGCTLVGQANADMGGWGTPARVEILIAGDSGAGAQVVEINVNFWTVTLISRNLITEAS